jgi:hypothetical protein
VPTSLSMSPVLDQLADLARWDREFVSDPALATSSLVTRLSLVPDRRKRRGLRHELLVVLVLAACATLVVGNDSMSAIWQWSAQTPQEVLKRLGARRDPLRDWYLVPSERCGCRIIIHPAQAACLYSWRVPPSRSRRRTSSLVIWSRSVIGPGSG